MLVVHATELPPVFIDIEIKFEEVLFMSFCIPYLEFFSKSAIRDWLEEEPARACTIQESPTVEVVFTPCS
jgi:hypothetical protein